MTIKYPLDKRESLIIEFALRFLDLAEDNLNEGTLDSVLADNELLGLYPGELETLADEFKGDKDD